MNSSSYRQLAKKRLEKQWGINVLLVIIVGILTGMISGISSIAKSDSGQLGLSLLLNIFILFGFTYALYYISLYVARKGRAELGQIFVVFQRGFYLPMLIINLLAQAVQYVLAAIFFLPMLIQSGSAVYVSLVSSGGVASPQNISAYSQIGIFVLYFVLLIVYLIVTTIVSVWFKFAVWVKFDHPELSVSDCLRQSGVLLKGRFWKYVLLQLSFIGWYVLGFVALLVGLLFVAVYVNTASALFYDQAVKETFGQEDVR